MRTKKGVPAGQRKPQAKEGRTLENSFEATLHVLANVSKKSKKNGTPPTAKAAGRIPGPKNCMTQKTTMTKAGTGSPKSIGQTTKITSPNHSCVTKPTHLRQGSELSRELLTTKEVHKGSCGNSSHQAEGGRVDGRFHGKIQSGKYACQSSTRVHENIGIHARNHQPRSKKKLNDNIPKSVDEMMSVTIAFLRGEVAAANQSKKKAPPAWKHHETSHRPNFDKRLDFKNQHKSNRRQDRFTPLTKTPKEILAMDTVKFKAPQPMTGPAGNRNKNNFCEFHVDKGHSTDECIHLRRQKEEAVKSGQLSHLVKEIKQGGKLGEHAKAAKKGEAPNKEKATAIFIVQP
ncbi:hypothetical protein Tco_0595176 [Tanacetum coccineum]